jgi:hypothetical protein
MYRRLKESLRYGDTSLLLSRPGHTSSVFVCSTRTWVVTVSLWVRTRLSLDERIAACGQGHACQWMKGG